MRAGMIPAMTRQRRWAQPPERDDSGRLAPEVVAAARRRVMRALLAVIVAAIAAGLLAYGCSRSPKPKADRPHYAADRAAATTAPQRTFAGNGPRPMS
jgi:hypothetical protein